MSLVIRSLDKGYLHRVDNRVYEIGENMKLEVDRIFSKVFPGGSKFEGALLNRNQVVLYFLLIYFSYALGILY